MKDALPANIIHKREWGISEFSASLVQLTIFLSHKTRGLNAKSLTLIIPFLIKIKKVKVRDL